MHKYYANVNEHVTHMFNTLTVQLIGWFLQIYSKHHAHVSRLPQVYIQDSAIYVRTYSEYLVSYWEYKRYVQNIILGLVSPIFRQHSEALCNHRGLP